MLCYVMLCYVMLCYVMLCYVVLCCVMLCYFVLCCVMLCYVVLCCVMLCYVVLCCVVLCCVVLLCMLCYITLYYIILLDCGKTSTTILKASLQKHSSWQLYSNEKNGLQQFQMASCQPIKRLKDKKKKTEDDLIESKCVAAIKYIIYTTFD
jgi:hypothetical protein